MTENQLNRAILTVHAHNFYTYWDADIRHHPEKEFHGKRKSICKAIARECKKLVDLDQEQMNLRLCYENRQEKINAAKEGREPNLVVVKKEGEALPDFMATISNGLRAAMKMPLDTQDLFWSMIMNMANQEFTPEQIETIAKGITSTVTLYLQNGITPEKVDAIDKRVQGIAKKEAKRTATNV